MRLVEELQNRALCLFIGDGINDAAALSAARIGMGVRGGLESAMSCANIYVADHEQIHACAWGLAHAARRLRWSLFLSVLYNVVAMAAVVAGWWGPLVCAIAMPLSSLSVILWATLFWPVANHSASSDR